MYEATLRRRRLSRKGLTLLELVVVMAILIAVAGILVPMLPDMIGKAAQSAGATNITEMDKAVMEYFTVDSDYPDGYDSLLHSGGEICEFLPSPCDDPDADPVDGKIIAGTIDAGQLKRLYRIGITGVYDFVASGTAPFHTTLYPYAASNAGLPPTTLRTLEADGNVAVLAVTSGNAGKILPGKTLTTDNTYVVFGIGDPCTVVAGEIGDINIRDGLVKEAPIFLHHKAIRKPSEMYCRLCVVYDVGPTGGDGKGRDAQFVCTIGLKGRGLSVSRDLIGSYHEGPGGQWK